MLVILQAQVFGRELVRHAKGFLDGVASVGESYFNVSGATFEQISRF